MWLFITARLRQWIILAIAVPLLTYVVRAIRRALEKRAGHDTTVTRRLGKLEDLGRRQKRRAKQRP